MSDNSLSDMVGNRVTVERGLELWHGRLKEVQDLFLVLDECGRSGDRPVAPRDGVRIKISKVDAVYLQEGG